MTDTGGVPSLRAVTVGDETRAPSRAEIRDYIAIQLSRVRAHAQAGGNPHQLLLDQTDQLDAFVALLPEPERADFIRVYTEEMEAALAGLKQEVEVVETAAIQKAVTGDIIGRTVLWIVAVFFIIFILRAFA